MQTNGRTANGQWGVSGSFRIHAWRYLCLLRYHDAIVAAAHGALGQPDCTSSQTHSRFALRHHVFLTRNCVNTRRVSVLKCHHMLSALGVNHYAVQHGIHSVMSIHMFHGPCESVVHSAHTEGRWWCRSSLGSTRVCIMPTVPYLL